MGKPEPPSLDVANRELLLQAFAAFQQGAQTADWASYFALMSEDYCFWYPLPGPYLGKNEGKARAVTYFTEASKAIRSTFKAPYRRAFGVGAGGASWAVFECEVEGAIEGVAFTNRVAVSFDAVAGRLTGHREYIGDVAPFMAPAG